MGRIMIVAAKYRARGHSVWVLSSNRIRVKDAVAGNVYRVNTNGRAIVGTELAAEIAAELEEPPLCGPA